MIDAALVTWMSDDNPLEPLTGIAETREQIIAACGSKYCPTSIGTSLRKIVESEGRFAVVGLPCQLHGLRKMQEIIPNLRRKIVLQLGVFCVNNSTFLGTEYWLKMKGISPVHVKNIRYRGKGWPGKITVELKDGGIRDYLRGGSLTRAEDRRAHSSAFHYDFMIPRCLLCVDLTNELADISFGDPWGQRFGSALETLGRSVIVVRSQVGEKLLQDACKCRIVELMETDGATAKSTQNVQFKKQAGSRIMVRKLLGKETPKYNGKKILASFSGFLSFPYYFMSYFVSVRQVGIIFNTVAVVRYRILWIKNMLYLVRLVLCRKVNFKKLKRWLHL